MLWKARESDLKYTTSVDQLINQNKQTNIHIKIYYKDLLTFNPLPDTPILGSSNSAANKDVRNMDKLR